MAPKQFAYAITRRDFDHHEDEKGSLVLVEIHASLESANAAAKVHLDKEAAKAAEGAEGAADESKNKDGGFECAAYTSEDDRDHFLVEVKKYELKTQAPAAAKTAAASSKTTSKKRDKPEPEEDEDAEDDAEEEPPAKKTAAKKAAPKKAAPKASAKSSVPEGKDGALDGLSILFTGTFDSMDRKTSEKTAEHYGGTIAKKLVDADWIILGVKAGQKKLDEIEEKGLKTMDEAQFLEMLKTGEPPE